MKRLTLTAAMAAALLAPGAVSAQSESPEATPQLIGVDTMDVCLAITGPVTLLTAETLTQGIIDGIFVIEGLSTGCDVGMETDPGETPTDEAGAEPPTEASPSPAS